MLQCSDFFLLQKFYIGKTLDRKIISLYAHGMRPASIADSYDIADFHDIIIQANKREYSCEKRSSLKKMKNTLMKMFLKVRNSSVTTVYLFICSPYTFV